MPRDRRPNRTPSSASFAVASKSQTINAYEKLKQFELIFQYYICLKDLKETIAVYEYPFYYSYLRIVRQFEFDKSEL